MKLCLIFKILDFTWALNMVIVICIKIGFQFKAFKRGGPTCLERQHSINSNSNRKPTSGINAKFIPIIITRQATNERLLKLFIFGIFFFYTDKSNFLTNSANINSVLEISIHKIVSICFFFCVVPLFRGGCILNHY